MESLKTEMKFLWNENEHLQILSETNLKEINIKENQIDEEN